MKNKQIFSSITIYAAFLLGLVLFDLGCKSHIDQQKLFNKQNTNSNIEQDSALLILPDQVDSLIYLAQRYPSITKIDLMVEDCDSILSNKIDSAIRYWPLLESLSFSAYDSSYIPVSFFSLSNLKALSINFVINDKYEKKYNSTSQGNETDLVRLNKRYIKNAHVLNYLSQLAQLKKLELELGLNEIPSQIFDLNIEELRLDFNCISNIDTLLYKMRFLKKITLVNNPIYLSKKQLRQIQEKLPRTKIYLQPPSVNK